MKSLSSVGLGLSIVFACLLIALVAELYYLLWCKKRFTNRDIGDDYTTPGRELFFMFCLNKPPSLRNSQEDTLVHHDQQDPSQIHSSKDDNMLVKSFCDEYDSVEAELMRLNSFCGPPRFLFTIVEETTEDLESEDGGKPRCGGGGGGDGNGKSRSLNDLLLAVETPYLTPLASPPLFTPPLTPMNTTHHQFDSSNDVEVRTIRSSPPPKFKFLQDAEEKLYRKTLTEEAEKLRNQKNYPTQDHNNKVESCESFKFGKEEEDGPFITIIVDRNREIQQCHSSTSSSQVLPLASSPSSFKTSETKINSIFHQNFDPQVK